MAQLSVQELGSPRHDKTGKATRRRHFVELPFSLSTSACLEHCPKKLEHHLQFTEVGKIKTLNWCTNFSNKSSEAFVLNKGIFSEVSPKSPMNTHS